MTLFDLKALHERQENISHIREIGIDMDVVGSVVEDFSRKFNSIL